MKTLSLNQKLSITGGDWVDRLNKQELKCLNGSARACRRAERMRDRHMR